MWPRDQISVIVISVTYFYDRSYHNLNFIRLLPEKIIFLRGTLSSSSTTWSGTRYGFLVLRQCGKKVPIENQNVLRANSYVCKYNRGKLLGGPYCRTILNRIKSVLEIWKKKNTY